jgi:ketosteroid isomerase-like protein
MRSLTIAVLAVGLAGPVFAQQGNAAQQDARQQIEAFTRTWVDAYNRGDGHTIAGLEAPHAIGVTDRGLLSGTQTIEQIIENEASMGGKVTGVRVDDVRMLGANAAVAVGPYTVSYSSPKPMTIHGTWMRVLERRGKAWKAVATSFTPSTEPSSATTAGAASPQPSSGSTTK